MMIDNAVTNVAALAAAVLLGFCVPAQQAKTPTKMTFGYVDGQDAVTIEVSGKDLVVLLNGEEMPSSRYVRQGNVVRCQDGHGRPVAVLNLHGASGTLRTLARQPHRLRLGVTLNPPSAALAEHLDLEANQTLIISQVQKGKAGDKAGLHIHDVITRIEGRRPATKMRIGNVLKKKQPGETVKLRIVRRGEDRDVDVVLEAEKHTTVWPGFDLLTVSDFAHGYPTLVPDSLSLSYLASANAVTNSKFVPYLLQSGNLSGFHPLTVAGRATQAGEEKGPAEGDDDLARHLRELEQKLQSLEKLLEKALDRLDPKIK